MDLSIVSTLYYSEAYVDEFVARAVAAGEAFGGTFEIVLVNDGSPDNALDRALSLVESEPRLVVIDLTRNFGHHPALLTGIAHAKGNHVFLIDSDLEEDPAWLMEFNANMAAERSDMVLGVQDSRKGNIFERVTGRIFYTLFRSASEAKYAEDQTTARLMTRRFVDSLMEFPERATCFAALCELTGYKQSTVSVTKLSISPTTYTLGKRIQLFFDSFTAFSTVSLHAMFYLGLGIASLSFVAILYLMASALIYSDLPSGWASVMVSIWFLGGVTMACVGVIGLYLAMVLKEVKQRPLTLIKDIHRSSNEPQTR